ncbi:class E sortase [Candidatus Saccharibacteria bacterium]|nr:class E sortase [Candidatus Saccharibacteria bacterium]
MRFIHKKNVKSTKSKKWFSRLLTLVALVCFGAGIYLLVLVMTPNVPILYPIEKIDVAELAKPAEDRIYIPKIGVNVALVTGGAESLDKGAWHRFPERGDPIAGGNFIISAHRFSIGATPGKTREKSPFYHINKLSDGDQIIVDFQGKRYGYEITSHKEVKPNQVEIEAPLAEGEDPRMTLYTCTFKGESDGREVYFAKPLGEVEDGKVLVN